MQDNYSQNYEKITDEAKLNALLERIFDSHSLLSVTLSGEQAIFNSALISIDTNKNNIVIDELHPERGNDKLQPSCKINIFTGIQGVDISFQCKLLETGKQSGILYHVLSYPEHIKYYQRRKSYRVQVIRSLAVNATLTTPDGQTIKGELHNISSGGVCIRSANRFPENLNRGDLIEQCELLFPRQSPLLCGLEVRHIFHGDRENSHFLGGRFRNINNIQQRTIDRFVITLEREIRKRS